MQLLILAHTLDGGAQAVARALAPILGQRLTVLPPEWLGQASWSHRVDVQGHAHTRLSWHGGRVLDSDDIGWVWNRIRHLPQAAFRASTTSDRDYAGAELQALVSSWLAELGERVAQPMRRHACVTPVLHHLHWVAAASRCGIPLAMDSGMPERFSVLCTPLELWGPGTPVWPASLASACHAMAEELGFALLSVGFGGTPAAPLLCRVEAHPALSLPGEQQAVTRWLLHRFHSQTSAAAQTMPEVLA